MDDRQFTLPLVLKRDELAARLYKERNSPHNSHWSPDLQEEHLAWLNRKQEIIFKKVAYTLSTSQICIWRTDLLDAALHNAPQFGGTLFPMQIIPTVPQWWPAETLAPSRLFKGLLSVLEADSPKEKLAGIIIAPSISTQEHWDNTKRETESLLGRAINADKPPVGIQVVFVHKMGFYLRLVSCSLDTSRKLSNGSLQTAIVSALSFMSQEFVQSKTIRLPARFNGFRQSYVPCINQILLRARRSEIVPGSQADTEQTPKEWQHCWTVRSHARRLQRPRKSDGQQVIWVSACVKGNTEKPMLPPRDTIVKVNR